VVFAAIGAAIIVALGVLVVIVLARRRANGMSELPDPSGSLYETPRVLKLRPSPGAGELGEDRQVSGERDALRPSDKP